jgi:hypothetical protein
MRGRGRYSPAFRFFGVLSASVSVLASKGGARMAVPATVAGQRRAGTAIKPM